MSENPFCLNTINGELCKTPLVRGKHILFCDKCKDIIPVKKDLEFNVEWVLDGLQNDGDFRRWMVREYLIATNRLASLERHVNNVTNSLIKQKLFQYRVGVEIDEKDIIPLKKSK